MPALQVKDFPDDLYEELRQCAEEECRSISQQTLYILKGFLQFRKAYGAVKTALWAEPLVHDLLPESERARFAERARRREEVLQRIRERGPVEVSDGFPDAAEIIRQMREERTDRILEAVGDLGAIREAEMNHDRA